VARSRSPGRPACPPSGRASCRQRRTRWPPSGATIDDRAEISVVCRYSGDELAWLRSPVGAPLWSPGRTLGCRSGVARRWSAGSEGPLHPGVRSSPCSGLDDRRPLRLCPRVWVRCSWRPSAPGRAAAAVRCAGAAGAGAAAGLALPRATPGALLSRSNSWRRRAGVGGAEGDGTRG